MASDRPKQKPARPDGATEAAARIGTIDWDGVLQALDAQGYAVLPGLIASGDCRSMAGRYDDDSQFRSRIVMARHGFGQGEYKYFTYPLPPLVASLRAGLYPRLAPIANGWMTRMRLETRFPPTLDDFLARCREAGQTRPTPLLLRYGASDYNCLHQDLYGATVFPLQVAVLLSEPGTPTGSRTAAGGTAASRGDFDGGEFVLVEQRPRMQSRASVVPLGQGDAVVFAVNERPVAGSKGDYRVKMRHGVSRIRAGARHTLGIIFHDAA